MSTEWNKVNVRGCLIIFGLALVVLVSVASAQMQQSPMAKNGPTLWTVLVGGEAKFDDQGGTWQFLRFYPENITVNVGDTIIWKINSTDPHTVLIDMPGETVPLFYIPEGVGSQRMILNGLAVFAGPTIGSAKFNGEGLVSSGQLSKEPVFPKEYNITFTKAGTFEYYCALHRLMKGKVTVQPAGTPYPKTLAQIDTEVASLLIEDMQSTLKAEPEIKNVSTHPGPNGTIVHEVKMGYGDGHIALHKFIPSDLTIYAGDSVEWTQNEMDAPHTVTFTSGGKVPIPVLAEPQQKGPPTLIINPEMLTPAGSTTYNGTGYFNSGIMWGTSWPIPGLHNYSLTFDTSGTYEYISLWAQNMSGQITVLAKK